MPQDNKVAKTKWTKRELLEAAAGQGATLADELTTEHVLHHGGTEGDPLARPFTRLPEPAYLAGGAALTAGITLAAHKLKQSHNKFLRGLGYVAQDIQIGTNAGNAIRNSQIPDAPALLLQSNPRGLPNPVPPKSTTYSNGSTVSAPINLLLGNNR